MTITNYRSSALSDYIHSCVHTKIRPSEYQNTSYFNLRRFQIAFPFTIISHVMKRMERRCRRQRPYIIAIVVLQTVDSFTNGCLGDTVEQINSVSQAESKDFCLHF